jgi:peptidoglycan hydrolase CwlO-like protein
MRRSISKALDKLDPSSSEETDSKFESILSDSATTQSEIQALFNAISNGISQQREVKKGMERVGSEQLEELRRGFGRVYDEEEEEEEGVGRARDEL